MSSKISHIGFGSHGHVPKFENHEREGFSSSPIMKSKSYLSKMKQNNSKELSGLSFLNICNKNSTPDPLVSKSAICSGFSRIFYRKSETGNQEQKISIGKGFTLRLRLRSMGTHGSVYVYVHVHVYDPWASMDPVDL